MPATVRFDDLTPGVEEAFEFDGSGEVVVARRLDEVMPALERVEVLSRAGWWLAGYVGYDASPGIDPGLRVPGSGSPSERPPLVWFGSYRGRSSVRPFDRSASGREVPPRPLWHADTDKAEYETAIARIKELIAAGDTYQVNHTLRLSAAFSGDALSFYRDLVLAQRGGYGAYVDTGRYQILSGSPESLFRMKANRILVKPMKGTARRGRWAAEDDEFAARLLSSEKDRAENLMIVDLLRSDLGRIARFGTVRPERLMEIERYDTVWQLTSTVSAEPTEGISLAQVFQALFPSGSVTGAPKRRTMEIISDLEKSARGVYCGAIGFVAPTDGPDLEASFNVAIRTAVVDSAQHVVEYGVGGGITWDSTAGAEFDEAMLKADVLFGGPPEFELLETLRWEPDAGYWLLERHIDRLAASARYFAFDIDPDLVLAELAANQPDPGLARLVRLRLARSGRITIDIGRRLAAVGRQGDGEDAVIVAISAGAVDSSDVMLFHKTTLRAPYEERAKRRPDVEDVLLVNERGEISESAIANVAVKIDDEWRTPPLASGCLPGVYRAELLDAGVMIEGVVTVEEVEASDQVSLINSVRGWQRAILVR